MDLLYLLKKWMNSTDFWKSYKGFYVEKSAIAVSWDGGGGARDFLYSSNKLIKMHTKVVLIMSNWLFFNWKYYWSLYVPFRDNGLKVKNILHIRLWVMSSEVKGLVAAKLSWVDPTSFVAMNSNTLLDFTELSGKSLDFYFLVGTHLN